MDQHDDALVVLLVEDDPAHAEIIVRLLQTYATNLQVVHISDGDAALDYLFQRNVYADRDQNPHPHLVLLDLRLPKVDGLEVLRQIKSSDDLRVLPVVVLSSSEAQSDIAAAYHRDANSFLVKPMNFKQFEVLIKTVSLYWLNLNRHPRP